MFVISMAGLSKRFTNAGFAKPKYMLDLWGVTCFDLSVRSFSNYFKTDSFLFILRDVQNSAIFVREHAKDIGIENFSIVELDSPTRGQAETVALGLSQQGVPDEQEITVFNIDTFRPDFVKPDICTSNSYLEVFAGSGENWSFVMPDNKLKGRVLSTAEKKQISNLCSTGLYHFSSAAQFQFAFEREALAAREHSEIYVAPIYNHLIDAGVDVRFNEISRSEVFFCGTPSEYLELSKIDRPDWV